MKIQMFNSSGAVNKVLNDFATFIFNRKSLSEATEKKFVKKLESLSGSTNSAFSLLQQRIDKSEIDYKSSVWGRGIIDEMKNAIKKHSR